ncbi:aminodeoxychorismate synthase component I [uncultured Litoreibacter sp.]|uniref:aminodeoxychorismate synthase component I n=1 Tax=uncultured Litoreibacter sp. TaxID=1392394 RepID=UPI002604BE82|nr:aminodeoxychorismate synthase component I [uncultured Litoreibacter sp.]
MSPRVLFDHGPLAGGTAFRAPGAVIRADAAQDVPAALSALQEAQSDGKWLAGFASYELGYLFSRKLHDLLPQTRGAPLLQFGVFDAPEPTPRDTDEDATLTPPRAQWGLDDYAPAFAALQDFIAAGDIYQANLTFPLTARRSGSIDALYARLRAKQPAPHGALVDLGDGTLLSRSPELFFRIDEHGGLTARPMKGTARRGGTPAQDAQNVDWLRRSEKNRAENLMITDLLRNDISRVARIGTVKVPRLFEIETYATLHQMTSTITARLNAGTTLAEIFRALFPCGSITGAPKIRAMQILRDLEPAPRDAYCGAIGWIAPSGAMSFNVAIRTLICDATDQVRLNVGGGIVHDSTLEDEYNEALLKARFAVLD